MVPPPAVQADTPDGKQTRLSESGALTAAGSPERWWVLLVIGIGSFMAALNTSVVTVILPILQRSFGSDVAGVAWVVTIFLLVVSGALLSFGRLGDLYGHRAVYVLGAVIFFVGSALCGLSATLGELIVFRGFQAVGIAMLAANETGILTKCFPAARRGQVLGLQSTMTYLGLTIGPPLGGWLTTQFSWRAVFFVNVPVGLLVLVLAMRFVPREPHHQVKEGFDQIGAPVFLVGLAALLLALNQGYTWGWFSPMILVLLGIAVASLAAFVAIEKQAPHPMLDLSLFQNRTFSSATIGSVLNNVCVSIVLFLLPFALIQGRGFSPVTVGVLLSIRSLVMVGVAPLSGIVSDHLGARAPRTIGLLILATGATLLARMSADSDIAEVALALAVVGLGSGAFISANNSALMGSAPRYRQGIAGGVLATARNAGMALGTGLAGAVLAIGLGSGLPGVETTIIVSAAQHGLMLAALVATTGAIITLFWGKAVEVAAQSLDISLSTQ